MQVDSAERWVKIATGPGAALVLLIVAISALWFLLIDDLQENLANQKAIIEILMEQNRLSMERLDSTEELNGLIKEQIASDIELNNRIELWLFRNVDTPEAP